MSGPWRRSIITERKRSSGKVRHVRMLGLCLLAALAVCAYAVSSASALPEWGKCEAKAGGKYEDSNCTVKAKGKTGKHEYEWTKGANLAPVKFTGHNVGSGGVLTTSGLFCEGGTYSETRVPRAKCVAGGGTPVDEEGISVECESETNTGEAVGKDEVKNVAVVFKGCKALGVIPCNSSGREAGEVAVNPLKGKLGYISKSSKEVGLLLEPVAKHGAFAEFICGNILGTVVGVGNKKEGAYYTPENHGGYDGIISTITPVNTMTSSYEQTYVTNGSILERANIPSKFEGKHIELLEDYVEEASTGQSIMWTAAGEEITALNTPAEPGEIKA